MESWNENCYLVNHLSAQKILILIDAANSQ